MSLTPRQSIIWLQLPGCEGQISSTQSTEGHYLTGKIKNTLFRISSSSLHDKSGRKVQQRVTHQHNTITKLFSLNKREKKANLISFKNQFVSLNAMGVIDNIPVAQKI